MNMHEIKRERKRRRIHLVKFAVSAVFCLPLLYLAIVPAIWWLTIPYPKFLEPMQYPLSNALLQIALTIPILLTGTGFLISGFKAFFRRIPNLDSLIAIGTAASMGYSLYSVYQIYTGNFGATDGLYFVTTGTLITLTLFGRWLEAAARHRADKAIQKIISETAKVPYAPLEANSRRVKAPRASMADTVSGYFVPIVCAFVVVVAGAWIIGGKTPVFVLNIFLSILAIACPNSAGFAVPAALHTGSRKGVKYGIFVKDAAVFEAARKVNMVVLGKSGTITQGKPEVTDVYAVDEGLREKLLQIAFSAEIFAEHPLGAAIVRHAQSERLEILQADRFERIPGYGVTADVDGIPVLIGSRNLMEERSISLEAIEDKAAAFAAEGKTPVYIAVEGKIVGIIALVDQVKEDIVKAIQKLQSMGIEVAMATGDHLKTAETAAKHTGVSRVFAQLTPQGRIEVVKRLQAEGKIVAVLGGNTQDVPSMLTSDVGLATGLGSTPALEASDIVLAQGKLADVATAIRLSKCTVLTTRGNLFWAFSYHVIGILIAAGLLQLVGGPLMNPVLAAAAMLLGFISVKMNTFRLKRFKPNT